MDNTVLQGRIMKGVGGLYTVQTESEAYACRPRGIFRKTKEKPLVGDRVMIEVISEEEKEGSITEILPRKNRLLRPECANVDRILLLFAVHEPEPNFDMLNRYLVLMQDREIPVVLAVTKSDLERPGDRERILSSFKNSGLTILFISQKTGEGLEEVKRLTRGCMTALAGPSGVGKSSLLNALLKEDVMETGNLSERIQRGKNTTRHSEIFFLGEDSFLFDTPGFTSIDITSLKEENLSLYFPEFEAYLGQCGFSSCRHLKEPGCRIRQAVTDGEISPDRYHAYETFYEELKNVRRY